MTESWQEKRPVGGSYLTAQYGLEQLARGEGFKQPLRPHISKQRTQAHNVPKPSTVARIGSFKERTDPMVPIYTPIKFDGFEFCLLRLLKGSNHPIRCELFNASLEGPSCHPKYYALSYTWGNLDDTSRIVVDEVQREVGKNLEQALAALRRRDENLILWVDTVCIDQENLHERNRQVQLMAKIYHNAEEVFIYLGETNHRINLAMKIMHEAEEHDQNTIHDWEDGKMYRLDSVKSEVKLKGLGSIGDAKQGLLDLLSRPWFDRVWILQEVAHARSARIFCGPQSVSTRVFRRAPIVAHVEVKQHCQAVLDIMPGISQKRIWWGPNRDIVSLLKRFKDSKATDERDKVYALLSISSDASESEHLHPEYQKCIGCVMYDTITFILNYHSQDALLEPFLEWNFNQLVENIGSLRELAIKWAVESKKPDILEKLLPHYGTMQQTGSSR